MQASSRSIRNVTVSPLALKQLDDDPWANDIPSKYQAGATGQRQRHQDHQLRRLCRPRRWPGRFAAHLGTGRSQGRKPRRCRATSATRLEVKDACASTPTIARLAFRVNVSNGPKKTKLPPQPKAVLPVSGSVTSKVATCRATSKVASATIPARCSKPPQRKNRKHLPKRQPRQNRTSHGGSYRGNTGSRNRQAGRKTDSSIWAPVLRKTSMRQMPGRFVTESADAFLLTDSAGARRAPLFATVHSARKPVSRAAQFA